MTRTLRLALLGCLCLATPVAAQSGTEPQLILSIGAGLLAGSGALWSLPEQGVPVAGSTSDTLGLARHRRPGMVATLAATYHPSQHFGYVAEGGYFAVATEQRCTPPASGFKLDAERKNEQACVRGNGAHVPTSVVGFQLGLAYRGSLGPVTPHVRVTAGVGFLANSFVRTEGTVQAPTTCADFGGTCEWVLLDGESTAELTYLGTLAVGASIALSPGYRFRFEVRDLIAGLPVPTAPAPATGGLAPVGTSTRHIPVITAGLDVVLERRRGRRY